MRHTLFILFFFLKCIAHSQNLVPNYSFEDSISCPDNLNQINKTSYWTSPTLATPDYFNSCSAAGVSVPNNSFGVEDARTGNAYAGIGVYGSIFWSDTYREYIQAPLLDTLLEGEIYCVELYVSLSDEGIEYAITNVGCHFSSNAVTSSGYSELPVIPQIENSDNVFLRDMSGWMKISGTFRADGAERFITIGNFRNNSNTNLVWVKNPPTSISYYYIDDVSVIHLNADAGRDTAICKDDSVKIGRSQEVDYIYNWTPVDGLSDASIAQPIAKPLQTTTYYLNATSANGCTKTDSITITVVESKAGSDATICYGDSVTIGELNFESGVSYNWTPSTGLNYNNIVKPIATPFETTTYTITSFANGCSRTDEVVVTVLPLEIPIADAGNDKTICAGDSVQIGVNDFNPLYDYSWMPLGFISGTTLTQPYTHPLETTTFYLTVIEKNQTQCSRAATDSVIVFVNDCPEPPIIPEPPKVIQIPNIITPNGDGLNDQFVITNIPEENTISIFNRWGKEVFVQTNYQNNWNAEGLSEGTYYYILSIPEGKRYRGFVLVVK